MVENCNPFYHFLSDFFGFKAFLRNDYIANYVEKKLEFTEQILTGKIRKIEETSKMSV